MRCYFASPFFKETQIEREERLKALLRKNGVDVYSPKEHGIISDKTDQNDMTKIFLENTREIRTCDVVFAITDEKDMGTIWESGYAYGINKPVIYYCETLGDNPFNVMLAKSAIAVYVSYKELEVDFIETGLYKVMSGRGNWNKIEFLKGY